MNSARKKIVILSNIIRYEKAVVRPHNIDKISYDIIERLAAVFIISRGE